jgi:seryl-tRNA synthetase
MIDVQLVRDNPELVKEKIKQKGYSVDIDKFLSLDTDRRELLLRVESLRQQRNETASQMKGGKPEQDLIDKGKEIKIQLAEQEQYLEETEEQWLQLLKKIPNMPLDTVPVGASEDENVEDKTWGEKPHFEFKPKNHWEIAQAKDWIDKERAAKVSGSRFAYIKGSLALMQFAIINFVLETLTNENIISSIVEENGLAISKKVFTPILPPVMIRGSIYDQMDRLEPAEDRYKIESEDDLWLIGSAEHTLGSMFAGENISSDRLPIRLIGYSTSFRQEAGTYGKDMEGIIRMHQFDKLEMETFSSAETGYDEHRLMIALQEYLVQQLNLPYRRLKKCTADIGKPDASAYDIEVWFPSQDKYRETHTADYMTDYQARRLNTKSNGQLVHTNDGTAFAVGRIMAAIIENYQTDDGNVKVPEALKPYLNGREIL